MKGKFTKSILLVLLAGWFVGCGTDPAPDTTGGDDDRPLDEWGRPVFSATEGEELAPGTKDDAVTGQRGLPVSVDGESTLVWEVKNQWEDTETPAARAAGIAWGENSGLNWDQKYQVWVDSMEKAQTEGGFFESDTFVLTTPWGKELQAPALECAETAIFLRIAFASWYNLPFFMEARDNQGRIYFGHFGMRRDNGRFGNMPSFKTRYADFSSRAGEVQAGGEWPSDSELRGKKIPGSFDDQQPMIGPDAHAGAYFDEVFLNKRVGHFLILTLAWFGSVNLADSSNTFNVAPHGIKPGDVLVERWQKVGIGHTLVVMRAEEAGQAEVNGQTITQFEAEVASGSMPRRQPVWESAGASKRYFTLEETGGEGFAEFGGGLKRWRTTKNVGGRWTNVVMGDYASEWVNSRELDQIAARPSQFEDVLVELSPDQKRDVLLEIIESKRQHLRQFPASCSARINREKAFDSLYELMESEFGTTRAQVDGQFRTLEDYVFAELEYEKSKTCCWNRTTNAMYEVIMDFNIKAQENASMCVAPVVFMNRADAGDGYELFRQHAISLGKGAEWVAWSEDESCPQRAVAEDTIAAFEGAEFCSLPEGGNTGGTTPVDPGNTTSTEVVFNGGFDIPDNDSQGLRLEATSTATGTIATAVLDVQITHTWRGDLEISLIHPDGTSAILKRADGDDGDDVNQRFEVPSFAGKGAEGTFTLVVVDTASQDTGRLNSAVLTLATSN